MHPHRRTRWMISGLIATLAGTVAAAPPPPTPQQRYERQLQACLRDPQYRVGGAATGECLEAATATLDADIERRLQALAAPRCAGVGAALAQAQQHWQQYRQIQCAAYQTMFDNTAMYLNGTACQLRVTLERQHELQQLATLQPSLHPPCD